MSLIFMSLLWGGGRGSRQISQISFNILFFWKTSLTELFLIYLKLFLLKLISYVRVTKIYIGAPEDEKNSGQYGLNDETTDDVLKEYFEQFGTVTKVDQLVWRDSGRKRGYGYVEFEVEKFGFFL